MGYKTKRSDPKRNLNRYPRWTNLRRARRNRLFIRVHDEAELSFKIWKATKFLKFYAFLNSFLILFEIWTLYSFDRLFGERYSWKSDFPPSFLTSTQTVPTHFCCKFEKLKIWSIFIKKIGDREFRNKRKVSLIKIGGKAWKWRQQMSPRSKSVRRQFNNFFVKKGKWRLAKLCFRLNFEEFDQF